jgi:hypothetical protein
LAAGSGLSIFDKLSKVDTDPPFLILVLEYGAVIGNGTTSEDSFPI